MLNSLTFPTLAESVLVDPKQNILIGAQYLLTRYHKKGTWELAIVAYNGGDGDRVAESALYHLSHVMGYERRLDAGLSTGLESLAMEESLLRAR
jgi:soluble lytic murein transglycosylase-like protein